MVISHQQLDLILNKFGYKFAYNINVGRLYLHKNLPAIIIDSELYNLSAEHFQYVEYTSFQNRMMHQYGGVYRFLATNTKLLEDELSLFLNVEQEEINYKAFGANRSETHVDPTPPEYQFSEIFEQVFGSRSVHALQAEYLYVDQRGHRRYIDYVLHRSSYLIAIELNGERYHHPLFIDEKKYRSQLFKQNSLVKDGYLVYRWSLRGMQDRFKFQDQLKNYFGNSSTFLSAPLYRAERKVDFMLYKHQTDAVNRLRVKKENGEHVFLVVLPTGTGKTEVFIEDLRLDIERGNVDRALAIVPTLELKKQLINRVQSQLSNLMIGDNFSDKKLNLVVQTSAFIVRHYHQHAVDEFDYILVDEAHRAASFGLRRVLEYYRPKYLLGLTATDERLDKQNLKEIFGRYEIDLTLEDAIKQGLLPQIRAFRLLSNIDLSNVRFNGKDYIQSDLQKTVIVPSRDRLIADFLLKYFSGQKNINGMEKQGVIFCVNVQHTKRMARLLTDNGISALSVHGKDRKGIELYHEQKVQFLCACDLLNEGWDAPQTSIVVMARPTMSKVIYMQQLGRGTRKCEGKEALYVIDVVDSYSAALQIQPWNLHGLLNIPNYQPFSDIFKQKNGTTNKELIVLDGIYEQERRIEPINIFNFEKEFGELLNEEQLARELFVSTSTIKSWIKKGELIPQKTLPFGTKQLNYFSEQQIDEIRVLKGIKERNEVTRKSDFLDFIEKRDYTFSYKIIFLLVLIHYCNDQGEINLDDLTKVYQRFYSKLNFKYERAEKLNNPLNNVLNINNEDYLKRSILNNPFEKFERKRFVYQCKDLNVISFDTVLWENLEKSDILKISEQLKEDAFNYYKKIDLEIDSSDLSNLLTKSKVQSNSIIENVEIYSNHEQENEVVNKSQSNNLLKIPKIEQLIFYPNLKIACGHFKTGDDSECEYQDAPMGFGHLKADSHFLAHASGNSMNGGKNPIKDGDLLLLEWITPTSAGSLQGVTVAIEMQDEAGDSQYLLRVVKKIADNQYQLLANKPDYEPVDANENMKSFARLKGVVN
jgi:superfamily II DNA or RNA helicase